MNFKISKAEANKEINEFFKNIKEKSSKKVKKIKRLAMNKKIPLKEKRKLFCKKCLAPYIGKEKIRIRNEIKSIECKNCSYVARWKIS